MKLGATPLRGCQLRLGAIDLFAPLHDIGEIGVPDAVLFKPGRFDVGAVGAPAPDGSAPGAPTGR